MKDYKRFTERDEFGNADIIGLDSHELASGLHFDELNKLTSALNRFAELEDKIESGEIVDRNAYLDYLMAAKNTSELTDREIEFFVKHNARVREDTDKELAALQKRLDNAVELPCKVGDTVYCIHGMSNPELKEWQVKEIILADHNFVLLLGQKRTKNCRSELSNFYNVWWFIDRGAAEARLEELKGGEQ